MPAELVEQYMNVGGSGLVIIAFFVLLVWIMRRFESSEKRYQDIIKALADQLPEIRHTLEEIKEKVGA